MSDLDIERLFNSILEGDVATQNAADKTQPTKDQKKSSSNDDLSQRIATLEASVAAQSVELANSLRYAAETDKRNRVRLQKERNLSLLEGGLLTVLTYTGAKMLYSKGVSRTLSEMLAEYGNAARKVFFSR